jgi:predicted phage terminase large subunit-like protein
MDSTDSEEKLRAEVAEQKKFLNDHWLSNLYDFNTYCLLVEDGKDRVKLSHFHREMCDFVDKNPTRQKLLLVPRGHLKSTLITIGKCLQWICKDPSVRILIANATYEMSITFLNVIKRHLQTNPVILEHFGPLAEGFEKWSENMITLKSAKSVGGEKEATVVTYGMGGNLVSQHFDKIILDDVVNEQTVNTRDQIEKTIQFYRLCQPLLEKNGEFIVIGTRWREDDLYGWIMDRENGIIQDFDVFERQAIKNELWDQSKGQYVKGDILWSEKYTLSELSEKRRKMGPWEFSAQYQNNPVPPEDADFKREWFRYYDTTDLRGVELNKYLLIDPAISLDKQADYTAMITVGIDHYSNVYILDIVRERMAVNEIINTIFQQYERWRPQSIGLEEVAFQRTLRYSIQKESEVRKRYLNIVELKPRARTKDSRIKGLVPQYANGKVLHNSDLVFNIYLEDELLRFPKGKHDDCIDALSYFLDLVHPPVVRHDTPRAHKYLYGH